ncbi:methyltransferase domain-containing protein [Candidatus Woesearchaeota archaeon]|nr:methyltransferase domain-containing protein [Candidatus Woesearchaeota archaeon]
MVFEDRSIIERKEYNKELYTKIFNITKKPKKILDFGCGLNPLYFPYKDIYYIATDINKNILKKVKKHFKKSNIKGEVFYLDIKDFNEIKKLNKVDVVFIFKVLDLLKKDKLTTLGIIKNLKTKFVVVSFPTKTVYGKRMNYPKRKWFDNILNKLKYKYEIIRFFNEIFYIIRK